MLKRILSWLGMGNAAPQAPAPAQTEQTKRLRIRPETMSRAGPAGADLTPVGFELARAATAYVMPKVPPGVIPKDARMAADSGADELFAWVNQDAISEGLVFPGYPYLIQLTARAEYRRPAEILAQHMTRKWIKLQATGDDADAKADKIKAIEAEMTRINAREVFKQALLQDGFFGRSQIFIDIGADDPEELKSPLSESGAKIAEGTLKRLQVIEPLWTYPDQYNTQNPLKDDFFRPNSWFVMGKHVHASRLLTIVSRPVPDMLKPSYIFGGLSLSQLAKPYIDNWLRTRQSVSDLLHSFNVFVLATNMGAVISGEGGDDGLIDRLTLFNRLRDNRGIMAIDKDSETFESISAPLGGLDHLQAQAQEHQSAVTGIPLVLLLGITPSGLNASSEGELEAFDMWIEAQQESILRPHLAKVLNVIQLSKFGEVDPEITFKFNPLTTLSDAEAATVRKTNADAAGVLIDKGVIDATEERERLANEEDSLYPGLDLNKQIEPPAPPGGMPGALGDPGDPNAPGAPGGEQDQADLAAMMAGKEDGSSDNGQSVKMNAQTPPPPRPPQ
jgi:phage-related protein (TIGR01555 family)